MQAKLEARLREFYRFSMKDLGHKPEPDLPYDFLYEVVVETKAVQRLVEIFADGRMERDSIWIDPGPWGDVPCLVHGSWDDMERDYDLAPFRITPDAFEDVWASAQDRAYPRT